ncbi:MAG: hypothetical protein WB341_14260 [Terracidiphilus sp.]
MQKRIVRAGRQSGEGLENEFALARKIRGDLRRKPVTPMARDTDLNHKAGPRRRA